MAEGCFGIQQGILDDLSDLRPCQMMFMLNAWVESPGNEQSLTRWLPVRKVTPVESQVRGYKTCVSFLRLLLCGDSVRPGGRTYLGPDT